MITAILLLAAQANVPPGVPAAGNADKVRCRIESTTLSRIPAKVCLPQSEWDRMAKETEADLRNSKNSQAGGRSGTIVDSAEGTISGYRPPK